MRLTCGFFGGGRGGQCLGTSFPARPLGYGTRQTGYILRCPLDFIPDRGTWTLTASWPFSQLLGSPPLFLEGEGQKRHCFWLHSKVNCLLLESSDESRLFAIDFRMQSEHPLAAVSVMDDRDTVWFSSDAWCCQIRWPGSRVPWKATLSVLSSAMSPQQGPMPGPQEVPTNDVLKGSGSEQHSLQKTTI